MPYILAPVNSTITINCKAKGAENFVWSIDLGNDSVSTQHQFGSRQHILNAHGVYELTWIETPGTPLTLRLLINDTTLNNQNNLNILYR